LVSSNSLPYFRRIFCVYAVILFFKMMHNTDSVTQQAAVRIYTVAYTHTDPLGGSTRSGAESDSRDRRIWPVLIAYCTFSYFCVLLKLLKASFVWCTEPNISREKYWKVTKHRKLYALKKRYSRYSRASMESVVRFSPDRFCCSVCWW